MPQPRLSRIHKVTTLVPLAILSGAWTASLAMTSANATPPASAAPSAAPSIVPSQPLQQPASVSPSTEYLATVPSSTQNAATSASAAGIPQVALTAYQRSAQVIAMAAPSCHLDWTLIAAIGRVESNHGRVGGSSLNDQGIATPGIYGVPLDGTHGTTLIRDTDGGKWDNDPVYDRAVGPMQFIPSTWAVVGVDGDGDGVRNPQDINDAALATGVYLCAGGADLSTPQGLQNAVYRYNHSQDYVNLVLAIMKAYANGYYTAVPNYSSTPVLFDSSVFSPSHHNKKHHKSGSTTTSTTTSGSGSSSGSGSTTPTKKKKPTDLITDAPKQVKKTVTALQQATTYCQDTLTSSQLDLVGGLDACVSAYESGGSTAVTNLLQTALADLNVTDPLSGSGLGGLLN